MVEQGDFTAGNGLREVTLKISARSVPHNQNKKKSVLESHGVVDLKG